ncbi:MAG: double-strand break repair protein AddB [Rhodospirillaceae bacterium]|nr:double-strand break repair protein AddB [Rhodospirillaceae bacterium]
MARIFSIPPGVPFVDALADGLLAQYAAPDDPLRLAAVTVLLPTRRACRALREAFLRRAESGAMLLPAMRPLGDVDEEELALIGEAADDGDDLGGGLDLPPAIAGPRRQLLLASLVERWWRARGEGPREGGFDQAVRLAGELGRLLDRIHTARLSFDGLKDLVPAAYAAHWQITIEFLAILAEHWPAILAEEGALDQADRRNQMLAALAEDWRARPPDAPVIAAGSTGSIPASADLLAVVAGLPQGAIVLPGLDRHADAESWDALGEAHPQYGLARLLDRLEIAREEVPDWPAHVTGSTPERGWLLSEAMRPESTTDRWRAIPAVPDAATDGLNRIDCEHPEEEAGVIALMMREVLETPGRTAMLVTPDRELARRTASALGRWGIAVDDSGGQPLADTAPGSFLRLIAAAVSDAFAPVPLLAMLKHPFAAGGLGQGAFRARVRDLERRALRGPRPASGTGGIRAALVAEKASQSLLDWWDGIAAAAADFTGTLDAPAIDLPALVAAHAGFAEWLAAPEEGDSPLWAGEAGEAAAGFVASVVEAAAGLDPLPGDTYPALLDALLAGQVVRPRYGTHPRLSILGPLEARLQHADRVILGGLNEGSWPHDPAVDPWMSRPMQRDFGLPTPERWIGLSAHDFAQLAAAPEVVLTRSAKDGGAPTVPSRWLTRIETLLHGRGNDIAAATPHRGWTAALNAPETVTAGRRPEPRPPVAARPRQLSVTAIETWMRDPYAVYARHVLKLRELDPIDADPGAADRGVFIHEALDRFVRDYGAGWPTDPLGALLAIGRDALGAMLDRPGIWAFWWPRFERVAAWFLDEERARRASVVRSATEVTGRLEIKAPAGPFTLTAKADRIDALSDGGLAIIDYKTGTVPRKAHVETGLSPQLPLEAAIAAAGGFEGVAAAQVARLLYWRLAGGDPAGESRDAGDSDAAALAAQALEGLGQLVARFDDPGTPYYARPHPWPEIAPRFSPYEHLARVREWSTVSGE